MSWKHRLTSNANNTTSQKAACPKLFNSRPAFEVRHSPSSIYSKVDFSSPNKSSVKRTLEMPKPLAKSTPEVHASKANTQLTPVKPTKPSPSPRIVSAVRPKTFPNRLYKTTDGLTPKNTESPKTKAKEEMKTPMEAKNIFKSSAGVSQQSSSPKTFRRTIIANKEKNLAVSVNVAVGITRTEPGVRKSSEPVSTATVADAVIATPETEVATVDQSYLMRLEQLNREQKMLLEEMKKIHSLSQTTRDIPDKPHSVLINKIHTLFDDVIGEETTSFDFTFSIREEKKLRFANDTVCNEVESIKNVFGLTEEPFKSSNQKKVDDGWGSSSNNQACDGWANNQDQASDWGNNNKNQNEDWGSSQKQTDGDWGNSNSNNEKTEENAKELKDVKDKKDKKDVKPKEKKEKKKEKNKNKEKENKKDSQQVIVVHESKLHETNANSNEYEANKTLDSEWDVYFDASDEINENDLGSKQNQVDDWGNNQYQVNNDCNKNQQQGDNWDNNQDKANDWGSSKDQADGGWGSNQKQPDDGWGSSNNQACDNWGNNQNQANDWGDNKNDDWGGNQKQADNDWGKSQEQGDGWGDNKNQTNDNWGNNNDKADDWGNNQDQGWDNNKQVNWSTSVNQKSDSKVPEAESWD